MLLYEKFLQWISDQELLECSILDPLPDNQPQTTDTLSDLIYKLSCTTNQMWYSQDILYKIRFMDAPTFMKEYGSNAVELHKILKRACDLNVQRANLMDAIDLKLLETKG